MDPTYPLVPVLSFVAAVLIFLTLLTSVRQTWNIGVLMLCMWLFIFCFIQGVETIVWSDNADNKAPVWCDISSHFGIGSTVGVPACSLVITRRLCNITRLLRVEGLTKRERIQRRLQSFLDLFIGIGIPVLVMGPFYYVVQTHRFDIVEGVGCGSAEIPSGLSTILVDVWPVILPLISAIFYCPRIVWTFYHQHREVNRFLHSNGSVNRIKYFRALAVGCLDILFTLPTGALLLLVGIEESVRAGYYTFYTGWYRIHHPWTPFFMPSAVWRTSLWSRFSVNLSFYLYPALSILVFAIWGLTGEARSTYIRWFWTTAGIFGFKPTVREDIPDMSFGFQLPRRRRTQALSLSMPESSEMDGADLPISMYSSMEQHEHPGQETTEIMESEIPREGRERRKGPSIIDDFQRTQEENEEGGGEKEGMCV